MAVMRLWWSEKVVRLLGGRVGCAAGVQSALVVGVVV